MSTGTYVEKLFIQNSKRYSYRNLFLFGFARNSRRHFETITRHNDVGVTKTYRSVD